MGGIPNVFMTWHKSRGLGLGGRYTECIYDVAQIPGVGVGWDECIDDVAQIPGWGMGGRYTECIYDGDIFLRTVCFSD